MDYAEVNPLDSTIKQAVSEKLLVLEKEFDADVIFFYGEIYPNSFTIYRSLLEQLNISSDKHKRLVIFLNTPGGSVETVEKYVNVNRYFYDEVFFVVPDQAMSAGTVFCMSGDKIYMDYSSSLGPIDPQIYNGERYVPALGYLDKIKEMVDKSNKGEPLNAVELFLLQKQDIAFLRLCEQQSSLTVDLIEKWLVEYKFKNWSTHTKTKVEVTLAEKSEQAKQIAEQLGDNTKWLSHGRCIDINKLNDMGLAIENYSENEHLTDSIRSYNDLLVSYIMRNRMSFFLNSRLYF
ncbi:SDH family Clp fold serine proteinase [Pectinatus frisingensis]|uniref:SDH family Clp fold serine proteinase n=1 Tax=Pectinatus frisingensis TaxID=865 RepID=UPI0018C74910|nr:ATP-dependent Clp protease proteolytic subunit [Pectinatus frisingensis]